MGILFAFAPFFVYVVAERLWGVKPGLLSAAVVSAALLVRDWSRTRTVKVLETGTLILFAGLAAYAFLAGATWSIIAVRLRVDAGLLLIVLVSLAVRRPFTLQYARETVAPVWTTPRFIRANYVMTAIWALGFAVMVAADLAMLKMPTLPVSVGVAATVVAIAGAGYFTQWYPEHS